MIQQGTAQRKTDHVIGVSVGVGGHAPLLTIQMHHILPYQIAHRATIVRACRDRNLIMYMSSQYARMLAI